MEKEGRRRLQGEAAMEEQRSKKRIIFFSCEGQKAGGQGKASKVGHRLGSGADARERQMPLSATAIPGGSARAFYSTPESSIHADPDRRRRQSTSQATTVLCDCTITPTPLFLQHGPICSAAVRLRRLASPKLLQSIVLDP